MDGGSVRIFPQVFFGNTTESERAGIFDALFAELAPVAMILADCRGPKEVGPDEARA
jgi:hypothetical protein